MRRGVRVQCCRFRNVGTACIRLVQHGHMNTQRPGLDDTAQGSVQQAARMPADVAHVDMGIGLVADQDLRRLHHRGRDHRMKVQGRSDGHLRPDDGAKATQELSLAVLAEGGHHRAVQRQENPIQRCAMVLRCLADNAGDVVKCLARNARAGGGMGRDGVRHAPARPTSGIQKAGEFVVHVAKAVNGRLAEIKHVIAEVLKRRFSLLEGVAFMDESAGQDMEGHGSWPFRGEEAGNRKIRCAGQGRGFLATAISDAGTAGRKGASVRQREGAGNLARKRFDLAAPGGIGGEVRVHQRPRVGVARRRAGVWQHLDHSAKVHHHVAVAEIAHQAKVMTDEQIRQAHPVAQVGQKRDDLGLDRHIKAGCGFVQHHEVGLQGQGTRDADALALPAGQLVRMAGRH